jgi:ubiquinone/menaquinone biosynthesis C-methylase UbiE
MTAMALFVVPDVERAMNHLYRTTKPGGKCYITSWHKGEWKDIATGLVKQLRGEDADIDLTLWKQEWWDPQHLVSLLEKVGFGNCHVETTLQHMNYPGSETGLVVAVATLSKMSAQVFKLKENEQERWKTLWEDALEGMHGVKVKMWANIGWGTK